TPVDAPAAAGVFDVALQPDGDSVVVGNTAAVGFVARFQPDGAPDPSFGFGGVVTPVLTDTTHGVLGPENVSVLPNGKILVGCNGGAGTVVAEYNPDGSLDTCFGVAGEVNLPIPGGCDAEPTTDGKILLIDSVGDLERLNANGSVDKLFGKE